METSKYEQIFAWESDKYFTELDELLETVETDPGDGNLWGAIHGKIHSIKGMATALGYRTVGELAQRIEAWCRKFQQWELVPAPRIIEELFWGLDMLKAIAAAKGAFGDGDTERRYRAVMELFSSPPEASAGSSGPVPPSASVPAAQAGSLDHVRVRYELIDELLGLSQEILALERIFPPVAGKGLPVSVRSWVDRYSSVLKILHFKLLHLSLVSVGDFAEMFSKVIRDQAREHGRMVKFQLEGEDVRADISLLERLREPLIHLIRNAVAHGIEPVDERVAAGKDPAGRLFIKASRNRDWLLITFGDDGRGIDRYAIKENLLRSGLDRETIDGMSEQRMLATICSPDYSSAGTVSDISGRGVGMSVVSRAVEFLGGTLTIASEPFQGTSFTMRLPVALTIIHAVTFTLDRFTLSIPTACVDSMERCDPGSPGLGSYCDLGAVLGLGAAERKAWMIKIRNEQTGEPRSCLSLQLLVAADAVFENKSIVFMPAGEFLAKIGLYSGVGVMEDGTLSIILDVNALISQAGCRPPGDELTWQMFPLR